MEGRRSLLWDYEEGFEVLFLEFEVDYYIIRRRSMRRSRF